MVSRAVDRLSRAWSRGRTEARDALELLLLPGLAALLPWRAAFWLFKHMAGWAWLYRGQCERALAGARSHGRVDDAARWLREYRLVILVDHADHFLSRTRSDAWLRRHVRVTGEWALQGQAGLLVTFHWGCGMWAQRHAHAYGLLPHTLVASPEGLRGRSVLRWYIRERLRTLEQAEGRRVIHVPGPMRTLRRAWAAQEQVVVVIDVPADQVAGTLALPVLGRTARVPAALARLAVEQGVPVTVYTLDLDLITGQRHLRLYPLGVPKDAEALLRQVFAHFDTAVGARPASWHLWSEAVRFFAPAPEEGQT